MPIDNINSAQPIIPVVPQEEEHVTEEVKVPESRGTTQNVITALTALAAIGAAGVAIYKHKSAKEAVKKAEDAAKKAKEEAAQKVSDAEQKAKQAADETKKIQETLDEANKKLKEAEKATEETPVTTNPIDTKSDSEKLPFFQRVKKFFTPKPKTKDPNVTQVEINFKPRKKKAKKAKQNNTNKPSFWSRVKKFFTPKEKPQTTTTNQASQQQAQQGANRAQGQTGQQAGQAAQNNTKKPSFWSRVKKFFTPKEKPQTSPTTQAPEAQTGQGAQQGASQATSGVQGQVSQTPQNNTKKPSFWSRVKKFFTPKEKPQTSATHQAPQHQTQQTVAQGANQAQVQGGQQVSQATSGVQGQVSQTPQNNTNKPSLWSRVKKFFTPKEKPQTTATHQAPQHQTQQTVNQGVQSTDTVLGDIGLKKPQVKTTGQVDQGVQSTGTVLGDIGLKKPNGIKMPSVQMMSDESLLNEYKSLRNTVNELQVMDDKAQRLLEIQGELINHRGYKFVNGNLAKKAVKPIQTTNFEQLTDEAKAFVDKVRQQLSGKADYKAASEAFVKKANTKEQHNAIQKMYDELAVKEPELSEIFKGIKMPDVKTISDANLLTEYNALKKIVQKLPVDDGTAQRLLKIQGELINHRGYKIVNGNLVKKAAKPVQTTKPEQELSEIFKGIKMPDVKTISDVNLLTEYNALKKIVQKLPVDDGTAQRLLEIQGELINHRGYKIVNGNLVKRVVKPAQAVKGEQLTEEAKATVDKVRQQLSEKTDYKAASDVFVLEPHTKKEHDAIQKEYNKLAIKTKSSAKQTESSAKTKKSTASKTTKTKETPKQKIAKIVTPNYREYKGLTEEQILEIEYTKVMYGIEDVYQYDTNMKTILWEKAHNIERRMQELGKLDRIKPETYKIDVNLLKTDVKTQMQVRKEMAKARLKLESWNKHFTYKQTSLATKLKNLKDKNVEIPNMTEEEKLLQGNYLFQKKMGFIDTINNELMPKFKQAGIKPIEINSESDRLIADYLEQYYFVDLDKNLCNGAQKDFDYYSELVKLFA